MPLTFKGYIVDIREIGSEKWTQYVSALNTLWSGNCITVCIFIRSVLQYPTVPLVNFDWPCRSTRTLGTMLRSPYGMSRPSVVCLSSVCLWLCCTLRGDLKFSAIFLHWHIAWGLGQFMFRRGSGGSCKLNARGYKTLAFSTNISLYFENGTRYAHSYNEDK